MKLVEQYIEVVGRQLPYKGRRELKAELKSSLLDEIEESYGPKPEEKQIKEALLAFGSPGKVAARYRDEQCVIAPGLTSFYFFLLKIVFGALALAFLVISVLTTIQAGIANGLTDATNGLAEGALGVLPSGFGDWTVAIMAFVQNTLGAWMGAFTFITVGFMVVTRMGWVKNVDLEEDWTPEELIDIEVGPEPVSRIESMIMAIMLLVMISLLNIYPQIVTVAEDLFLRSGIGLGHRLNVPVFRMYVYLLSVVWLAQLVYHGLMLAGVSQTGRVRLIEAVAVVGSLLVLAAMVADGRLYTDYTGMLGFRLVFIIILVVEIAEAAGKGLKALKSRRRD